MKILERLLEKLAKVSRTDEMLSSEVIMVTVSLVLMFLGEVIGILVAIEAKSYFMLSTCTFIWVWMIVECFINKIFFKKLDSYLLETPKATTLVCCIIFIIAMILSFKYFVGCIIIIILTFMIGDYRKNKENKNEE